MGLLWHDEGFIDRARLDATTGLYNWGARGVPSAFPEQQPGDRLVHTLSLWHDLESVAAYAYRGRHSEALRGRRNWCVDPTWPTYFAWWTDGKAPPTWSDGYERFDIMHRHGPTAAAFDFRNPYEGERGSQSMQQKEDHCQAGRICILC